MGCDQSDIAPFTHAFNELSGNGQQYPQPQKQGPGNQRQIAPESYSNYQHQPAPYQQPHPQQGYPQQQYQQNQYPQQPPYPQQANQNYPPALQQGAPVNSASPQQIPIRKPKRVIQRRDFMPQKVNKKDDFLTHHLKYELSMTPVTSKLQIQRRQILEHIVLQRYWGNVGGCGVNISSYTEVAQLAWLQRTFLDIWEVAHDEYFNKHVEEKQVRLKVAEQYMLEIYQLREFVDAGLCNINFALAHTRTELADYMQLSDDAVFYALAKLEDRYPMVSKQAYPNLPKVESTKCFISLLDHFPSKAFSDPQNINTQLIFSDINFLLKRAIEEQETFKSDMKAILGDSVLANAKVSQTIKDGVPYFNACAVRRVFIKWVQNLLDLEPDIKFTEAFLEFIKSKAKISNNFYFRSTVQPTTHKFVIDALSYLLQVGKYDPKTMEKRKSFIFNIYDLLRCKIKKDTPEQVIELFRKMQNTKVAPSGKRFEVIRVKNRLQMNNRDLLVNFRYGDVLVGEAQLCVDESNVSKLTKMNYEFCHYIYELGRSLFGPTLELMMQYEDIQRPDICVTFQAEGEVKRRTKESVSVVTETSRECFHGHKMIGLVGNYFIGDDVNLNIPSSCVYCPRMTSTSVPYHYCFKCTAFYCRECQQEQKVFKGDKVSMHIEREELLIKISNLSQLKSECQSNGALVILFHLPGSTPSDMFKDALIYNQCKEIYIPNKAHPKIALAAVDQSSVKEICNRFKIDTFPTLVLFNNQMAPIRTIIGYSWLQVGKVLVTYQKIINGQSHQLEPDCLACTEKMEFAQLTPQEKQQAGVICGTCFNTSEPINLPQQYLTLGGSCSNSHYRCINCLYYTLDIPSTYKDLTGYYLSEKIATPKLRNCPKGHKTVLTKKNILEQLSYDCFGCHSKSFFNNEKGFGYCEECKVFLCDTCIGVKGDSFQKLVKDDNFNLALHYSESTAEQGCVCACNKLFKKSYKTRIYSIDDLRTKGYNNLAWTCLLCQQNKTDGDLHMACFNCQAMNQMGHPLTNLQVCSACAGKSGLIMRQPEEKAIEEPSYFSCSKRHPMVKTSLQYGTNFTYDCQFCSKKFYTFTERFYCKTCNTNCCSDCLDKLGNNNPPQCNQRCPGGEKLTLNYKAKTLRFCDVCRTVVKDNYFSCAQHGYDLCNTCSSKPVQFTQDYIGQAKKAFLGATQEDHQSEEGEFNLLNLWGNKNNVEASEASEGGDFNIGDWFD